ncbi:transposase family protein [Streptomyces sp. WAC07094]|uniref:transposase family protein n=1 Tax=Streptomyces sp. WAC07094 TaxID=3072183 RepID=UPI002EC11987|nr:transposase family protein [Streptomyces sp. WAC07094]
MPADTSSRIPPALDQLREQPEVVSTEVPGLLERLAEVPDPRDARGVRHPLAVVLALAACAVLSGATSLLTVGEWIADAPALVLRLLGVPSVLCPPRRRFAVCWPVSTPMRATEPSDAGRQIVVRRRPGMPGFVVWPWTARACAARLTDRFRMS